MRDEPASTIPVVELAFVEAARILGGQLFGLIKTNQRHTSEGASEGSTASKRYRDMFLLKGSREVTR
jgi:hypothetical protein